MQTLYKWCGCKDPIAKHRDSKGFIIHQKSIEFFLKNIKTILDRITTFNNVEQLILQTLYRNADLERDNYALMQALFDAKKNTPVEESKKVINLL